MAVRVGYKQTEVGIIPEDWKVETLGKITTLMTNGFVGSVVQHYDESGNGVLYIQGYNVEENSFNFHGIKFVTEDFHHAHMKSCLCDGDLLTIQTGEVGLTTIVPEILAGSNCHALIISRFKKNHYFPLYVSYYLNSKPGRARLRLIETGTTMKHLNVGDMLNFTVPFPPTLAEQEAIAAALSDADALIAALEGLIAKKRQIKQGAMQELLTGKRRLPGFEKKTGYQQTEIGVIPDDWEVKQLGQIANIRSGGTPSTANGQNWDGGILWCTPTDITSLKGYKYLCNTNRTISQQGLDTSSAEIIPSNSIIMTSRATIGECAINQVPVTTNQGFKNFIPFNQINFEFFFYLLQTQKQGFIRLCGGSTFLEIGKSQLVQYSIPFPPTLAEQEAIAEILGNMDAEIETLETKLSKARQVKQGMMQELLTGRIRLV